ncbi:hypothetical protein ON010_g13981 [Phytophthora cinnamomi]|nr:hypothetical protein ON010_g13981 [Phytophthora cinnamomi]
MGEIRSRPVRYAIVNLRVRHERGLRGRGPRAHAAQAVHVGGGVARAMRRASQRPVPAAHGAHALELRVRDALPPRQPQTRERRVRARDALLRALRRRQGRARAPLLGVRPLRVPHGPPLPLDGQLRGLEQQEVLPALPALHVAELPRVQLHGVAARVGRALPPLRGAAQVRLGAVAGRGAATGRVLRLPPVAAARGQDDTRVPRRQDGGARGLRLHSQRHRVLWSGRVELVAAHDADAGRCNGGKKGT